MNAGAQKILKISLLAVFFLFIIFYAFWRSEELIFGVKIRDVNLEDGTQTRESVINITGNAKNAVNLTLNGREISVDQEGNFNETVALLPGYNIINIGARDKFGNKDEKNYQITYSAEAE